MRTKWGIVAGIAGGVAAAWYGVETACSWLVGRSIVSEGKLEVDKDMYILATFGEKVDFITVSDDYSIWCKLMAPDTVDTQHPQFITHRIYGRNDGLITIRINTKEYSCQIDKDVDLTYNRVTRDRCQMRSGNPDCLEKTLGFPVETSFTIDPGSQNVILYGRFDSNSVFHAKALSNYPVDKFKSMIGHKKASKLWLAGFGFAVLASIYMFKNENVEI